VSFAEKTGIKVVAEGVETPEELKALQALNVNKAQGYLLGRPAPIRDIMRGVSAGMPTAFANNRTPGELPVSGNR
jgi:EAL domain-containing protein (putative c-di-GMP-specific phosphodiesterase class I)